MVTKVAKKPRKSPTQARSQATVQVILEATIQVLVTQGAAYLTTARIAERAGVSVGSIYQYYPNKQALLLAVLNQHLEKIIQAIESVCDELNGQPLEAIGCGITSAFVAVKMERPDVSRALYMLPSDEESDAIVTRANERGKQAIANLLRHCSDARFEEPDLAAAIFTGAMVGPVQMMLTGAMPIERQDDFTAHLIQLGIGYLRQVSVLR
ncbi:TetR/AcrR family transcriptional regulator [Saccharospirillum sp. HFRX-1]|uniref:TetR/AcrR family transcriptional regulator n=1 Tax=unclassified Saccharospirillum TaxID=2633430 RepID=UPI0037198E07